MTDVFISYSRKDKAFVQSLHEALNAHDRDTWVDWEDIPLTADWWHEIQRGIEGAQTFVFILSPDSVASRVCREEIDHAMANHKRLVPIVHREGFTLDKSLPAHDALNRHNWLFFREQDEFDTGFQGLLTAIDTDLEYVRAHTRLLERAIEWDTKTRNPSFLLRGDDLEDAEQWLAQGASKEPRPTELQGDYISTSRKTETARQKADRRTQRLFTAGMGAFALVAVGAAGVAFQNQQEAISQKKEAVAQRKEAEQQRQIAVNKSREADQQRDKVKAEQRNTKQALDQTKKALDQTKKAKAAEAAQTLRAVAAQKLAEQRQAEAQTQTEIATQQRQAAVTAKAIAEKEQINAEVNFQSVAAQNLLTSNLELESLIAAIKTGQRVKQLEQSKSKTLQPDTRMRAIAALRQVVYGVEERNRLEGHSSSVHNVSFSPDGKTLATGSDDNTVKLWDVPTGHEVQTLKGHSSSVYSVSFSSDGKTLATGSWDKTVKLWAVATGHEVQTLQGHSDSVSSVSFSLNGKTLATGSDDTTVKLWNLNLDDLLAKGCGWLHNYLQNNPNVSKEDKHLCDGVRPPAAQPVPRQSMQPGTDGWWGWLRGWGVETSEV